MSNTDTDAANLASGFAGLPSAMNAGGMQTTAPGAKRVGTWYELPKKLVRADFYDKFSDEERRFFMAELSTVETERSTDAGGSNPARVGKELQFTAIRIIGNWNTRSDRDRLEEWWECIGAPCKNLVQAAFMKQQSANEADTAAFLDSGVSGRA